MLKFAYGNRSEQGFNQSEKGTIKKKHRSPNQQKERESDEISLVMNEHLGVAQRAIVPKHKKSRTLIKNDQREVSRFLTHRFNEECFSC